MVSSSGGFKGIEPLTISSFYFAYLLMKEIHIFKMVR